MTIPIVDGWNLYLSFALGISFSRIMATFFLCLGHGAVPMMLVMSIAIEKQSNSHQGMQTIVETSCERLEIEHLI